MGNCSSCGGSNAKKAAPKTSNIKMSASAAKKTKPVNKVGFSISGVKFKPK